MSDKEIDHADYLIKATRKASEGGMTKEQFMHAAEIFWDSWHKCKKFMDETK